MDRQLELDGHENPLLGYLPLNIVVLLIVVECNTGRADGVKK